MNSIYLLAVALAIPIQPPHLAQPAGGAPPAGAAFPATSSSVAAPSVEDLLARALARSPALAALRARIEAAREMERPAAALPDPMAEAMLQHIALDRWTLGEEDMSMAGVELRQGLLYPGKRRAAGTAAQAETARQAADLAALERQVVLEVRALYARLYAVDREGEALAAARELVEMLSATASARYATGEAEQEALIKAQLEISRLGEEIDDLGAERAAMVAELNRWLDQPGGAALGRVAELPTGEAPAQDWEALAAQQASAVVVAGRAVAAAEARLRVAELELKPNFSAAAGLASRAGLDPVVTLRFGIEYPFWKKQKQEPMIRAARQELAMAERELADAGAMARAEAARLDAAWRTAGQQVVRYRDAILPQTSAALDAARASYLAGRGDFSTVIEDFDLWLTARAQLARREADRFTAWAGLVHLTQLVAERPPQGGAL